MKGLYILTNFSSSFRDQFKAANKNNFCVARLWKLQFDHVCCNRSAKRWILSWILSKAFINDLLKKSPSSQNVFPACYHRASLCRTMSVLSLTLESRFHIHCWKCQFSLSIWKTNLWVGPTSLICHIQIMLNTKSWSNIFYTQCGNIALYREGGDILCPVAQLLKYLQNHIIWYFW